MFIIFWDFLTEPIFLSPQVKQSAVISKELAYTNCLTSCQTAFKTYILRNKEISGKVHKFIELKASTQALSQN